MENDHTDNSSSQSSGTPHSPSSGTTLSPLNSLENYILSSSDLKEIDEELSGKIIMQNVPKCKK